MREQILYYAVKYRGEWNKITQAIADQEAWSPIAYAGAYVTIMDDEYPAVLKKLRYAPWIIFYEGNLELLKQSCVSIVGARDCDAYGMQMCKHVVDILKKNYVIVSGLAKGIDGCAHRCALSAHTIGVIGCGLDVVYPSVHADLYAQMKKQHLIISEYPYGTKPLAHHFPWRNRMIAALGQALVVIQARKRSGTMLSVNEAIELSIPVYCIPHNFGYTAGEGCNLLISQGANILLDDDDIRAI